jgi:hypothetical protein
VCARRRGTGNPDAKIRSAQMETNPGEALKRLIVNERQAAADENSAGRKKSEGVAWEGTHLSDSIRATEFVPRLSEELQQCSGCKRVIPGATGLVWTTVFFPKHTDASSLDGAHNIHGRHGEDQMRLCAECHGLKVIFELERRRLAQRETAEAEELATRLNDGTMQATDAETGRMDYQILLCGDLEQRHIAARALAEEDLLVGHHGPRKRAAA